MIRQITIAIRTIATNMTTIPTAPPTPLYKGILLVCMFCDNEVVGIGVTDVNVGEDWKHPFTLLQTDSI